MACAVSFLARSPSRRIPGTVGTTTSEASRATAAYTGNEYGRLRATDVALAENAAQARAYRAGQRPDLVLLDNWMPDVDRITLRGWAASGC